MNLKTIITTLLLMATVVVSAQGLKTTVEEDRKAEIRKMLALDYSMPDYSTNKADAKIIGERLAKIIDKITSKSMQSTEMGQLSVMQAHQIEGMNYCAINSFKLNKIVKQGNELTQVFDTSLKENAKKLKKAKLVFNFFDGVSEDVATNDFFTNVCRYIR